MGDEDCLTLVGKGAPAEITTMKPGMILFHEYHRAQQFAEARCILFRRRQRVHSVPFNGELWWHVKVARIGRGRRPELRLPTSQPVPKLRGLG